jgi:hypothetical protein
MGNSISERSETKTVGHFDDESSVLALTIREGPIAASIWRKKSAAGVTYYDFSLARAWKSQSSGKAGYSRNFFSRHKAGLLAIIEAATQWIEEHELALSAASDDESATG